MRISDWSSDVCSSDLEGRVPVGVLARSLGGVPVGIAVAQRPQGLERGGRARGLDRALYGLGNRPVLLDDVDWHGQAPCRHRDRTLLSEAPQWSAPDTRSNTPSATVITQPSEPTLRGIDERGG